MVETHAAKDVVIGSPVHIEYPIYKDSYKERKLLERRNFHEKNVQRHIPH